VTDCPGPPCVFISKIDSKKPAQKSGTSSGAVQVISPTNVGVYIQKTPGAGAHTHRRRKPVLLFLFLPLGSRHMSDKSDERFFLYRWLKIDSLIAAAAAAAVRHTHTRSMGSRVYRRSGVVWPCWNGTSSCCRPTNQSSCINSIALLFSFFPPMTHREYKPPCPDWSPCGVAGRHLICGRGGSYRLDAGQIPDNKKKPAGLFPTKTLFVFSKNTRIIISNVFI
jgi:hypothetical protein